MDKRTEQWLIDHIPERYQYVVGPDGNIEDAFALLCSDALAAMPGNRLKEQILGGRSFAYAGKPGQLDAWEKWMRETGPLEPDRPMGSRTEVKEHYGSDEQSGVTCDGWMLGGIANGVPLWRCIGCGVYRKAHVFQTNFCTGQPTTEQRLLEVFNAVLSGGVAQ